jgi:hypothetical protein
LVTANIVLDKSKFDTNKNKKGRRDENRSANLFTLIKHD